MYIIVVISNILLLNAKNVFNISFYTNSEKTNDVFFIINNTIINSSLIILLNILYDYLDENESMNIKLAAVKMTRNKKYTEFKKKKKFTR